MRALSKKDEESVILRFLWRHVAQHKKWLIASFVFALGATFVQIQTASLVKRFMDDAFIPKNWDLLIHLCGTLVALYLFDSLTDFFHRFTLRIGAERTIRGLRREIFQRLLMISSEQAAKSSAGKATTHILSDTFVIGQGLHVVADILREPVMLVGLLGYLFYLNWRLTVICAVSIPIIIGLGRVLGKSARRNQSQIQGTLDNISNHIHETVGGLRTAHSFNQTPKLQEEFEHQTQESYRWLIRLARVEETVSPATKWFTSWVGAGLMLLAGWFVIRDQSMTVGDATAYITAAGLLQQPLRQLNQVNVRLQTVIASGRRVYDLLTEPLDQIGEGQKNILLTKPRPAIQEVPSLDFLGVSYRYPPGAEGTDRELALRGVTLSLKPGTRLALVGKSGSGKTTFSLLAMRFLDPSQGEILLNGKPAKNWPLADFRSHFAYVSQDVFLFNRSVRENMLFAKSDATDAQIWQALERASIKEFIEKLPQKLDTNLALQASNLSGGERQRLAIARAFLRDAPLLVLDEATSQLDAHSEKIVQTALADLMKNRSVLVIAHRLSTVREADQVAVFENGEVLEYGKPTSLLSNPHGHFTKLWEAQGHS